MAFAPINDWTGFSESSVDIDETILLKSKEEIVERGHFLFAGTAKCCPKIKEDHFSLISREGDFSPVDVIECKIRGRFSDLGKGFKTDRIPDEKG
jgi:hypothetical protein